MANQNYILSTADFSARHDGDRNSLIIVNTSDQIYNSVSASGFSPMSEKSFSVKGTLSFTAIHKEVLDNFVELTQELGFTILGLTFSPVKGPEGNIEFLAHLTLDEKTGIMPDIASVVADAHYTLKG